MCGNNQHKDGISITERGIKMRKSESVKQKRKKWPIILAVVLILGAVSYLGGNSVDQQKTSNQPPNTSAPDSSTPPIVSDSASSNPLMESEFFTADVMNGFGTEKIGEWGYIEVTKSDMSNVTGDQITEFCKNKCDNSDLNWIGIIFEDGTGLHITPGSWFVQMDYGTIDVKTATFSDKVGAVMPETWDSGSTPINYKYVSFEELYEIQASVENLLDSEYSGFSSCTVDFMENGPGYSISLLIDDADGIETLEALVSGLGDNRIAEIHITAMQDGKIIATN